MECKFCQRNINNKGSLVAHEKYCKSNPNREIKKISPLAGAKKGCIPWNKGKTYKELLGEEKSKEIKEKIGKSVLGNKVSENVKIKLRKYAKERKLGGYIQGSGRGIKGWYKGIWCDSSWELAYVIYCIDHGLSIKRCMEKRTYIHNGVVKNYIPDFIVNDILIEIKGYKSKQWEDKIKFNPDIKVLYENDLCNIFTYVKDKYGEDYIKLYEKN